MGNQSGKNIDVTNKKKKNRVTKILKRFEMCPAGHRSSNNNNKNDVVDEPQRPERKIYHIKPDSSPSIPPSKPKQSEWVDVPLDVPESPPRYIQHTMASPNNNEMPKVPPRQHYRKKKSFLDDVRVPVDEYTGTDKKPVEETIIIPKKEKIHICDGTHHHAANYQLGEESRNHKNMKYEEHLLENEPSPKRQKTISVISLPDYNQLKFKAKDSEEKHDKNKEKSSKIRNISVGSLPSENKVSFSAATAERLENYITKCKSFGSLKPQQFIEKINNQGTENDSDDSWDGLDDWDLSVLEHESGTSPAIPPYIPKSTVDNKVRGEKPIILKNLSLKMPNSIEETEEQTNTPLPKISPKAIKKGVDYRRESIDDFFTNANEPDSLKREEIDELIKNFRIGRRGSEAVQGYDVKCYPFRSHEIDTSFQSDSFFSTAFIENESNYNNPHFPFKNNANGDGDDKMNQQSTTQIPGNVPQKALRRRSGSVNTIEIISNLQNIKRENSVEKTNEEMVDNKLFNEKSNIVPTLEASEHSNLLKIINENSLSGQLSSGNKIQLNSQKKP